MIKVIITRGLPGSGKTTWAKKIMKDSPNSFKRVNKDELRAMLDDGKFSRDAEKFIVDARDALILAAIRKGKHVIVDDTNLASKHIDRITQLVKGEAKVEIQDFTDVTVAVCIERDLSRVASVGSKVIKQMYNQFLMGDVKKVEYVSGLPDVVICDLDGTLSLMNGRDPYDASTCENDLLNPVVAALLIGKDVIFVSGREEKFRDKTIQFLKKYQVRGKAIFMRETGDFRKDFIVLVLRSDKEKMILNESHGFVFLFGGHSV